MAQEKMLAISRMMRTPWAMAPELRTISMSAVPGEPTSPVVTGAAVQSSWKR